MEYHRTKDILYVMKLLGHKNIASTLIYTQLVEFEGDEYCSAVASSVEEAKKCIEQVLNTFATMMKQCHSEKENRARTQERALASYVISIIYCLSG
jgi:hypothetical protein